MIFQPEPEQELLDPVNATSPGLSPESGEPAMKRQRVVNSNTPRQSLPVPCPLPPNFSRKVVEACDKGVQLTGVSKLRLLREAALFYYGICPLPTPNEYITMAKTLCNAFPQLKDKKPLEGRYWVWLSDLCKLYVST